MNVGFPAFTAGLDQQHLLPLAACIEFPENEQISESATRNKPFQSENPNWKALETSPEMALESFLITFESDTHEEPGPPKNALRGPPPIAWDGTRIGSDVYGRYALGSPVAPNTGAPQVVRNRIKGNQFDDFTAETKLKGLDQQGLLGRQERLPTPDIQGKNYIKPDYTIYNKQGTVAAYADAKAVQKVAFDSQAQGLVQWAKTSTSRTLIYYVPKNTPIAPSLLRYASREGVKIKMVVIQ